MLGIASDGVVEKKIQIKDKAHLLPSQEVVWVSKSDQSKSCDPESGVSLLQGREELKKIKILVFDSKKKNKGRLYIQMCGAPGGTMNVFLIPRRNLTAAISLGYEEFSDP